MTDNVFIFGAGFSYDAGIPLLNGFVEKMLDIKLRESCNGEPIESEILDIFNKAITVKNELDNYHARSSFDAHNIEDILSILSFNVIGNAIKKERDKLTFINRAIEKTIDLSCNVKHPGVSDFESCEGNSSGHDVYRKFWRSLFNMLAIHNSLPTIITFNYDLVLERSLLQTLIGTYTNITGCPFKSLSIKYFYDAVPNLTYQVLAKNYFNIRTDKTKAGTCLRWSENPSDNHMDIEILKLHGSLNFPLPKNKANPDDYNVAAGIDSPYILPPIFNKMADSKIDKVWNVALQRLRDAKNIVIIGYSLPKTDIYMQYFLKSAFGPNTKLRKIFVCNPILDGSSSESDDFKNRYSSCFSENFQKRIYFLPLTTEQFVNMFDQDPDQFLF